MTRTPDFYRYSWAPLVAAIDDGDEVVVGWADGTTARLHHCWLQENAFDTGVDPVTREGIVDPADLVPTGSVAAAAVAGDGALEVTWADGSEPSRYHPGWLRHLADGHHRPEAWLPPVTAWTAATLPTPPTHRYTQSETAIIDHTSPDPGPDPTWLAFANDLLTYGLARLAGTPLDERTVGSIGERFGPLRDTNFGLTWDVRADPIPTTVANTERRLGPHTDLPTRETPPGFQLLHCLVNTTGGGESQMTDGLAVARRLEAEEPHHYEALTTLRWVFFNRGDGIDHRWSGPIIDLGVAGAPVTFRAFYPVRAFPDMDPDDVPRAYAALRRFSQLAGDPEFQISFPLAPGDLVAFDNRRVLHGRSSFDTTGGHRHLRGCYLDHDDVRSSVRVWRRAAAAASDPAQGDRA